MSHNADMASVAAHSLDGWRAPPSKEKEVVYEGQILTKSTIFPLEGDSLDDSSFSVACLCMALLTTLFVGWFPGGPVPRRWGFGCLLAICSPFFFFLPSPFSPNGEASLGDPRGGVFGVRGVAPLGLRPGRGEGPSPSPSEPAGVAEGSSDTTTRGDFVRLWGASGGSTLGAEMRVQYVLMKCACVNDPRCSWSKHR